MSPRCRGFAGILRAMRHVPKVSDSPVKIRSAHWRELLDRDMYLFDVVVPLFAADDDF